MTTMTATTTTAPHPRLAAYRRRVAELRRELGEAKEHMAYMQEYNSVYRSYGWSFPYGPVALDTTDATIARLQAEIRQLQGWIDALA